MKADTITDLGTLVVEDSGQGLMLALNTGATSIPLALFASATTARQFIVALSLAKQVAHAAGRSGI